MPASGPAPAFARPVLTLGRLEPIQILILQPTAFCNIDCTYCYLPGRDSRKRMGFEVLERIADEVVGSELFVDTSLILWHAGEPCVVPVAWYERAHAILQKRAARKLRFQFQTNGTLIDETWVDFIKASGSGVTLSIDGPASVHDLRRVDRRGRGTHERIMQSARLLQAAGAPFSCIAVVTADSLDHADEIFDFFYELQPVSVGFSTEEAEGANASSSLYTEESLPRIEAFFARLTERNLAAPAPMRIRELEHVLRPLRKGKGATVQNQECALAAMVTISTEGDVAFFSPENLTTERPDGGVFAAGNIMDVSFHNLLNAPDVARMQAEIDEGVENCRRSCAYFRFCAGGAPSNKYFEAGTFQCAETWHCRATKQAVVSGITRALAGSA